MDILGRIQQISENLRLADQKKLRPFGVEEHAFRLLPPLAERELLDFEARHHVVLPEEYRSFVRLLARGGAGPAYGLIPFEEALTYQRDALPDRFLSEPFQFSSDSGPRGQAEETDEEVDARLVHDTAGTMVLCHEGCGYLHLLVCTGPSRGQIWMDGGVSDQGYWPMGVGFLDWYERWLNDVLAGGRGTWWLQSPSEKDTEFQRALQQVKPWWRRGR